MENKHHLSYLTQGALLELYFRHMRLWKIQMSLHIHAVWLKSSLDTFWTAKKGALFRYADNEDSDKTAQMCRLIWIFIGHECRNYVFSHLLMWKDKSVKSQTVFSSAACYYVPYLT